jgi:hypothetical protein
MHHRALGAVGLEILRDPLVWTIAADPAWHVPISREFGMPNCLSGVTIRDRKVCNIAQREPVLFDTMPALRPAGDLCPWELFAVLVRCKVTCVPLGEVTVTNPPRERGLDPPLFGPFRADDTSALPASPSHALPSRPQHSLQRSTVRAATIVHDLPHSCSGLLSGAACGAASDQRWRPEW